MHIFKGFDFQTLWKKSPLNRNSYTLLSQNNRPKLHEIFHVNEMRFEVIHFAIEQWHPCKLHMILMQMHIFNRCHVRAQTSLWWNFFKKQPYVFTFLVCPHTKKALLNDHQVALKSQPLSEWVCTARNERSHKQEELHWIQPSGGSGAAPARDGGGWTLNEAGLLALLLDRYPQQQSSAAYFSTQRDQSKQIRLLFFGIK